MKEIDCYDYKGYRAYESHGYLYFYNERGHFIFKTDKNARTVSEPLRTFIESLIERYEAGEEVGEHE